MIFKLIICLGLFGLLTPSIASDLTDSTKIILISIDESFSKKSLSVIQESLEGYYQYDVEVESPVILSGEEDTLYSGEVLDELIALGYDNESTMIAVTENRLMLKLDEGVERLFRGYTHPDHNITIISTHLLQLETDSEEDLNFNLAKLAKHKIGHLLGLHHCEFSDKCFMVSLYPDPVNFYNSGDELCSKCRDSISLHHLRDSSTDKSDSLD